MKQKDTVLVCMNQRVQRDSLAQWKIRERQNKTASVRKQTILRDYSVLKCGESNAPIIGK